MSEQLPEDDAVLHDHERRLKQLEELNRSLEESAFVTSRITNNLERDVQDMDALVNQHTRWLVDNEVAMTLHRQHMSELDGKLDRIADLVLKGLGGGNGHGQT
jgi:G:T-mismatch repair DNA endonuclease (very short patch repair protein)